MKSSCPKVVEESPMFRRPIAVVCLLIATQVMGAPLASAALTCEVGGVSYGVTISGSGTIAGTNGNDVIRGSDGPDTISGRNGDDVICGLGGADTLDGGPGW